MDQNMSYLKLNKNVLEIKQELRGSQTQATQSS